MTGLNTPISPSQLREALMRFLPMNLPVLIIGQPGCGKTAVSEQVAAELGWEYIPFFPAVSDPTDFKGMPWITSDGKGQFIPISECERVINAKEPTLVSFEDIGQATKAVQASLMPTLHARIIAGKPVSDKVVFVGTTNRRGDKAGVNGMLEPLRTRYVTGYTLEPSAKDFIDWALKNGISMETIALIRFRPELVNGYKPSSDFEASSYPRTIHAADRLIQAGIPAGLEGPTLSGAAGEAFAAEYIGFMKVWKTLPKLEEIRKNPDSAPVPAKTEPATMWATCGMIANAASPKNMKWILKYAARLPKEFEVMLVTDCYTRDRDILDTREYAKWAANNNDVMMGGRN